MKREVVLNISVVSTDPDRPLYYSGCFLDELAERIKDWSVLPETLHAAMQTDYAADLEDGTTRVRCKVYARYVGGHDWEWVHDRWYLSLEPGAELTGYEIRDAGPKIAARHIVDFCDDSANPPTCETLGAFRRLEDAKFFAVARAVAMREAS